MTSQNISFPRLIFAVCLGLAIPSLIFGRVVFASFVTLPVFLLLTSNQRRIAWFNLYDRVSHPIVMLILVTFGLWVISALGSDYPIRSLEAVLRSVLFIIAAMMIHSVLNIDKPLHRLSINTFTIFTAITTTLSLLAMTVLPELFWSIRLKGWLSTPLYSELKSFSSLSVIIVPLLGVIFFNSKAPGKFLALMSIAGMSLLVWETYNRAAIAGFLAMGLALFCAWLFRKDKNLKILFSIIVFLLAAFALVLSWLWVTRSPVPVPPGDWLFPAWMIDFQRQVMWSHSLNVASNSPWFGIGANTINFAPGSDLPLPHDPFLTTISGHPHNWLVEIIAETGFLGTTSMAITILVAFSVLFRTYRNTNSIGVLASIAIMAGYWGSGLFNFSYWSAWWQVSFFLGLALSFVWGGPYSNSDKTNASVIKNLAARV